MHQFEIGAEGATNSSRQGSKFVAGRDKSMLIAAKQIRAAGQVSSLNVNDRAMQGKIDTVPLYQAILNTFSGALSSCKKCARHCCGYCRSLPWIIHELLQLLLQQLLDVPMNADARY